MIRQIINTGLITVFLLTLACWAIGTPQHALSCLLAGALVTVNLVILAWTLKKIFQKKSVALAVSVIVIKYAALLGIFITLYSMGWSLDFGFAVGISAMFPILARLAYQHYKQGEVDGTF